MHVGTLGAEPDKRDDRFEPAPPVNVPVCTPQSTTRIRRLIARVVPSVPISDAGRAWAALHEAADGSDEPRAKLAALYGNAMETSRRRRTKQKHHAAS
jgi:hypothetical protein